MTSNASKKPPFNASRISVHTFGVEEEVSGRSWFPTLVLGNLSGAADVG